MMELGLLTGGSEEEHPIQAQLKHRSSDHCDFTGIRFLSAFCLDF